MFSHIPRDSNKLRGLAVLALTCLGSSLLVESRASTQASTAQLFGVPMSFEENQGQTADQVRFLSRGQGYALFLTPTETVLSLRTTRLQGSRQPSAARTGKEARLSMRFAGANPQAEIVGVDALEGVANYFLGNHPDQWRTGIPTYGKVKYKELYPGVDLVYYGNQRQVEYDFVVKPHANPKTISIKFSGAGRLEIDAEGGLIAHLSNGDVRWRKPFAYQETETGRKEIPANFVLKNPNEVRFQIADYDSSKVLTIDPVMVYATYLGGNKGDFAAGIVVDASGNAYVLGDTASLNYPTTAGAYHTTSGGSNEVFVTKLNSTGSGMVYSTYLGGSGDDFAAGIALDSSGNVYITGSTESPNFPTQNPAYSSNAGLDDAFITKIGPSGNTLLYSTYLGGNGDDFGRAIAVDAGGNAYVAGTTYSKGTGNGPFPTTQGAYQGNNGGGNAITADAFVTKFDANGLVVYSTFLGGSTDDKANGIAVDSSGNAYIVGQVESYPTFPDPPSSDFPLVNAYQSSFNRGNLDPLAGNTDGFLTKMNATGTGLIFSTFVGGNDDDRIYGITLDSAGRIYLVGETSSTNYPATANAVQPVNAGVANDPDFPGPDAFISKFETNGTTLLYSTYLGGTIDEFPFILDRFGIAVDKFGDIYVAGQTGSFDFPLTTGADQTNSQAAVDAFIAKINPAVPGPAGLIYSTLLSGATGILPGGADNEAGPIAVDNNGNFYVAGITTSTNFPVTSGVFRSTNGGGGYDSFVAKYSSPADISVTMIPSLDPVVVGSNVTYTIQVNNNGRSTFSGVTNFVQFTTNSHLGYITTSLGSFSTNSSGLVIFNIGTLTNNASVTQIIVVTNIAPGTVTNVATLTSIETPTLEPNTDNNVAAVPANIQGIADVTLSQTATPGPILVSSNITYTLTVNNKGPFPATQVLLTNVLSPYVTFVSATNTFGNCSNVGGVVYCDFATIPNGTNARITIMTTAATNGVATNLVNVSSFEADFSPNNNTSTALTTINALADLNLGMSVSTNSVYVTSNITFTLFITNYGPSSASAVFVTNALPPGTTLVSASATPGSTNLSSGVVAFNLGTITNGGFATATLTLKSAIPGSLTNVATISSGAVDLDLSDNSASATAAVIALADLALSQTVAPSSVFISDNVTFTIVVTNRGPSTATNVVLTDTLPPGLSFISAQWSGSWTQANGVVTLNAASIASGSSLTANIVVQPTVTGVFTSAASVTSPVTDPSMINNSANSNVTVNDNPGLPLLRISQSGPNVILSWSTNAASFVLQSATNLSDTALWSDVTNTPVRVGPLWFVTNSVSGSGRFYRLHQSLVSLSATLVRSNAVVISWSANAAGAVLKSATNLTGSTVWITMSSPSPTRVGDRYYVTNPATSRRFFRLYH